VWRLGEISDRWRKSLNHVLEYRNRNGASKPLRKPRRQNCHFGKALRK